MNIVKFSLSVITLFALSTFGVQAQNSRVYIQFKPGTKAQVENLIKELKGAMHHQFDNINALAVTLPQQALAGLGRNPNVELIEPDPPRYLYGETVPYGIDLVGARDVWDGDGNGVLDLGAPTGTGIRVGVIDSGIRASHQDFAGVVINGYYGANLDPLPFNGDPHGTHVAGTIAAAFGNDKGVTGVSPGTVELYSVRVFGNDGTWAYSSTLLDAVQRCANEGQCNVINMSLGGSIKSRTEEQGMDAVYDNGNGVLLVAAAGNDGNTRKSYPAAYSSVIAVAAVDHDKVLADFSQRFDEVELAGPGVNVLSTVPYSDQNNVSVGGQTFEGNRIEGGADGTVSGLLVNGGLGDTVGSWSGQVVLIQRGNISFAEKIQNAEAGGAVAAIIYNNAPGNFNGTLGDGVTSGIPAISVSDVDGAALMAVLGQSATVVSSFDLNGDGYAYFSGTSMATPHVVGVAALAWSAVPTATAGDVRLALQLSAEDLGDVGRDKSFGYGLVNAPLAVVELNALFAATDTDGDGVTDDIDNCPDTWNADQQDSDGDGIGDVCDNCPGTSNPGQDDLDGDGEGDVCDDDIDGDGVSNLSDNCPTTANPLQEDFDGDSTGDVCDDDIDGDGVSNANDPCPYDPFNTCDVTLLEIIGEPSAVAGKGNTFIISWTTSIPADSKVIFTGVGEYVDSALTTDHSMSFRGQKGASYTYTVESSDGTNVVSSGPHIWQN